ncbi:MAG: hypothetical protein J6K76_03345, partial [Spirochaetaceae bacterium]|nr:hypothetical protein [Spirochaetaceae bacterium]
MGRCIYGPCGDCEHYEGAGTCYMYEPDDHMIEGPNGTIIDEDTGDIFKDDGPNGWKKIGNVDDEGYENFSRGDDDDDDD